jgi:chemotaxis protein histidine kinase CheA
MQLDDLLSVLRAEFAQSADDIDAALMAWLGDEPAQAVAHCEGICATLDTLASVSRMVALEGQALAIECLRDAAQILALSDAQAMADGLGWLVQWREPLTAAYERPADPTAAEAVVTFLTAGPVPPNAEAAIGLLQLLCQPPVLPQDDPETQNAAFADPTEEDVALTVPDDVDPELYDTFLADAPAQAAALGDTCRRLASGPVDMAEVIEAQRVAHTFKGSGNIIGIRGVGKLAHRIEDLLEFAAVQGGVLPAAMARDVEVAAATLEQMIGALRGEEAAPQEALSELAALNRWARAIGLGDWQAAVASDEIDRGTGAVPQPNAAPARVPTAAAPAGSDIEAQVRLPASHMNRLVRRAGQQLVQRGRINDHVQRVQARLAGLQASHHALAARLLELQAQIDRQGVNLQAKVNQEGVLFDPLEMDRYNELHSLARFVAELAADGLDLAQGAQAEAQAAQTALAEHERDLKAQHTALLSARLLPFKHIASRLRRNVSQTATATGKRVQLHIEGEAVLLDSDVLERLTEPLLHLLRNAVDHGIEAPDDRELIGKAREGRITLAASRDGQMVHIVCRDDGGGLNLPAIHAKAVSLGLIDAQMSDEQALAQLILLPGFSTRESVTDVSGRGVGMDVVAERVRAMKGHIDIQTEPLTGTTFTLRVPATLGSTHALIVEAGGERFALPTEAVVTGLAAPQIERRGEQLHADGRRWRGAALAPLLSLADKAAGSARPAVVLRVGREELALEVDRVLEARELILQDVGRLLRRVRGVSSAALRNDGRVLFVLNPDALAQSATTDNQRLRPEAAAALRQRMQAQRRQALVVDDSLSVRKSLAQLLGDAGYEVRTARDGFDALDQLTRAPSDIVLTDLEMPNLNGLDFTRRLRQSPQWQDLPVLMLTSRATDKHRDGALQAGVSDYLTKPYTDADLLDRVRNLLAA